MSLNGRIQLQASFDEVGALDLRSGSVNTKLSKLLQLVDGAGAGAVQKIFSPAAAPAVAQSVNTDYDLVGTLAGTFGVVSFTAIKAIIVIADALNPGALTLFGGTNPFLAGLLGTLPTITLAAGQPFVLTKTDAAGWPVTGGSNDNFRIITPATVGTYSWDLLVVGI